MKEELKILRVKFNFTQADLAKKLGYTQPSSYARKENGETEFTLNDIKIIKQLYGLSADEICKIFLI
ncbi:MAG: helix-turn-helix transcriptional regulator [Clostridium sp.]